MFDLRLGLALKKSLREIHALPYPEWKDWRTLSLIEPWGWRNEEANTARILALLHNTHAKEPREVKDFIRDLAGQMIKELEGSLDMQDLTPEEKKRKIADAVKKDFGIK